MSRLSDTKQNVVDAVATANTNRSILMILDFMMESTPKLCPTGAIW